MKILRQLPYKYVVSMKIAVLPLISVVIISLGCREKATNPSCTNTTNWIFISEVKNLPVDLAKKEISDSGLRYYWDLKFYPYDSIRTFLTLFNSSMFDRLILHNTFDVFEYTNVCTELELDISKNYIVSGRIYLDTLTFNRIYVDSSIRLGDNYGPPYIKFIPESIVPQP